MRETSYTPHRDLYPPISPFKAEMLDVGDGHRVYVEQCGNPGGLPVIFLHGGPGGGISSLQRRFFDPERYRIILFDQRGCGRSTPHADLTANTTHHLIDDIERIRKHLSISRWVLFGGSWGSTLALLYGETHPERVIGLILRGIFLATQAELDWFYGGGTAAIFPEKWADFIAPIPENERHDLIAAYYKRINDQAYESERLRYAKAWSLWEGSTVSLVPDESEARQSIDPNFALAFARIEAHYFQHKCFMSEDGALLKNAHRLKGVPVQIVQGRYDSICPPRSAYALAHALDQAELTIVPVAGHSAFEPGIRHELICATDQLVRQNIR